MANEFQHKSVGSQLSQTEYEHTDGTGHVFDSQAAGDLAYASSSTVLSRLGIGTAGKVLMVNSGASAPEWQNAITGVTSILNTALVIGRDADNDIDFATDNNILFRAAGADQIKLIDGALAPVTDNDVDLGTSSLEFKDAFFDGTVTADAFAGPLTGDVTGNADTFTASANNSTDETVYPVFVDGATGSQGAETDTGLTYNPSSGILTATQFTGAVSGTATLATSITASANNSTDETVYPTFVDGATGTQGIETDTGLTYNPSSGVLTSTQFTGALSGNATTATALATGRTIAMTGDVAWTSASFDGSGNVTGAGTIQADAVESGMLNDNIISGQTEITSGLNAADELLYSDGGTVKRIGLDTLATKLFSVASADTVAQASDHMVFLDGGATGDVIIESIDDFLSAIAGSGVSVSSSQLTVAAGSDTVDMGDGFVMEDGDGTEVTITENKEVKFVEGNGIDINWTDVDNGTDGDPYDLTFTVDHDAASNFVAAEHYDWSSDISGTATIHANNVSDLHGAGVSGSNNQLLTDDGDGTVTSESNLTFDGTDLNIATGSIEVRTIDYSDGDNAITIADGGGVTFAQGVTLADDKSITLGDEGQIIFSDVAPSTDHSATGIVITGTLASGVAAGMAVYLKADGEYDHADKDTEGHMPAVGVALEAAGDDKKILIYGVYVDASLSLTRGEELYVGDDGAVTHTVPGSGDFLQRVGVALTTTSVLFMPSLDVIEHA